MWRSEGDTIVCGGVLGRIFVSRSSYCRPYLEHIYLQGQFWRAKFPSETTCKIMIQWPFFSSRTTMNTNISPTVCSPVELFRRGTRKTFLVLYPDNLHRRACIGVQQCLPLKPVKMARLLELEWVHVMYPTGKRYWLHL